MAQSVKRLTLDFDSCHDLTVGEFEPRVRLCADSAEPAWDSLSPSLPLSLPSLKINKRFFKWLILRGAWVARLGDRLRLRS